MDGLALSGEQSTDTKRSRYAAVEVHDLATTSAADSLFRHMLPLPCITPRRKFNLKRLVPARGAADRYGLHTHTSNVAGLTYGNFFVSMCHSDHTLTSPTRVTPSSGTPHATANLFLKGVAPLGTAVASAASYAINSATLVVGSGGGGGSNNTGSSSVATSKRRTDTNGPSTSASIMNAAALARARSPQPSASSGLGGPSSMSRTLSSSLRPASPSHNAVTGTADLAGHRSRSDSDGRHRMLEAMRSAPADPREGGAAGLDLRAMRTAAYRTHRTLHRTPTDPLAIPTPVRAPSLLRAGSSEVFQHRRSASLTTSTPPSADMQSAARVGNSYRHVSHTSSGSLDRGSSSADSLLGVVASATGYNASGSSSGAPVSSSSGAPIGASSLTESREASPVTPIHAPLTQSAPPSALREM